MKMRTLFALCALAAFGSAEARTASAAEAGKDKKKTFADMIVLLPPAAKPRDAGTVTAASVKAVTPVAKTVTAARTSGTVRAEQTPILTPRAVALFDARLTRFIRRFPNRVPPATSFLPGRTIAFRQEFVYERFTPGATVGGVFFTSAATPFIPGAVNIFNYFPVYLFGV